MPLTMSEERCQEIRCASLKVGAEIEVIELDKLRYFASVGEFSNNLEEQHRDRPVRSRRKRR